MVDSCPPPVVALVVPPILWIWYWALESWIRWVLWSQRGVLSGRSVIKLGPLPHPWCSLILVSIRARWEPCPFQTRFSSHADPIKNLNAIYSSARFPLLLDHRKNSNLFSAQNPGDLCDHIWHVYLGYGTWRRDLMAAPGQAALKDIHTTSRCLRSHVLVQPHPTFFQNIRRRAPTPLAT